ncbi:MAG: hypothetical protein ACRCYV_11870 [Aeromonas sp.]
MVDNTYAPQEVAAMPAVEGGVSGADSFVCLPADEVSQPRNCASAAPSASAEEGPLLGEKFETCKNHLNVLRIHDQNRFNIYTKRLNENVNAINSFMAISSVLPEATAAYLTHQHRLALNITCDKILGAVNNAVIKKVPSMYL